MVRLLTRAIKVAEVRQAIEKAKARLEYLPPCSANFNPIKNMSSKVKQSLRSQAPRTARQLLAAAKIAFAVVSTGDCQGFLLNARYDTWFMEMLQELTGQGGGTTGSPVDFARIFGQWISGWKMARQQFALSYDGWNSSTDTWGEWKHATSNDVRPSWKRTILPISRQIRASSAVRCCYC